MKRLTIWLVVLVTIVVIFGSIKEYIHHTTDPTLQIGTASIHWRGQYYESNNSKQYEVGRFICRTSNGHKLYEMKGDTAHHSVVVLFPGFPGRYHKYKKK